MALSDSCFEFLEAIREGTKVLADAAEHYSESSLEYGGEISALRRACIEVEASPWSNEAAVRLLRLASSVMKYHDTPPGSLNEAQRRDHMDRLISLFRSEIGNAEADEVAALILDLTDDTPKAESAALKLKPLLVKLGKSAYDVAIKIITDVASGVVKKVLGL